MFYEISQATRSRTSRCPHGFSCLNSNYCGKAPLCEVKQVIGPMMAFVNSACQSCGYYLMYGTSHVCTCPTRIALHREHGV